MNSQKLVVLAYAIGSRHRAGLDLPGICRNREIGNKRVFAFTRPMRDDDAVRRLSRHIDGIQGFGERTDLIHLNEDCIRDAHSHAAREAFRVGDKKIVADELYLPAQLSCEHLPAIPVVLGEAILDRDDRILRHPVSVEFDHICCALGRLIGFLENVSTVLVVELTRRGIQSHPDLIPRLVTGGFNSSQNQVDRLVIRFQIRRKPSFIAHGCLVSTVVKDFFEIVKYFGSHPQGFRKARSAGGHDHEFLQIDIVIRVRAAINDVHHRDRK